MTAIEGKKTAPPLAELRVVRTQCGGRPAQEPGSTKLRMHRKPKISPCASYVASTFWRRATRQGTNQPPKDASRTTSLVPRGPLLSSRNAQHDARIRVATILGPAISST